MNMPRHETTVGEEHRIGCYLDLSSLVRIRQSSGLEQRSSVGLTESWPPWSVEWFSTGLPSNESRRVAAGWGVAVRVRVAAEGLRTSRTSPTNRGPRLGGSR